MDRVPRSMNVEKGRVDLLIMAPVGRLFQRRDGTSTKKTS